MTDRIAIIERLWETGHFWKDNPDISITDACKCELNHPMVEQAMESAREADANYDILRAAEHGRWHALDASFGPATERLLTLERCAIPDIVPPADVPLDGVDPDLRAVIESMWATGDGSWPVPGCAPPHEPDVHSIRININTAGMTSGWREDWPTVERMCVAAWAEVGMRVVYVMDGDPANCEISKRFMHLAGHIGWNQFPRPGTCNQVINGRLGTNYDRGRSKPELELHESAHGMGWRHTPGGVMNPTILHIRPLTWRGDPHEATARRHFGGKPIPIKPTDPDKPPPPNPIETPELDATIRVNAKTYHFVGKIRPEV